MLPKFTIAITLFFMSVPSSLCYRQRWTEERAKSWYEDLGFWPVGPSFIPSTAENQLEFWQPDTFDVETITRELGWVHDLGMTAVRVFLHYMPWEADSQGYIQRMEQFLDIATKYNISTMFVLFDDCWDPEPKPGPQPPVIKRRILSRWVQCPGKAGLVNETLQDLVLQDYVKGVIGHFKNDKRVFLWDLYNEPGQTNFETVFYYKELPHKSKYTAVLIEKVFDWARQADPIQPLTAPIFKDITPHDEIQSIIFNNSDIISFHSYAPLPLFIKTQLPYAKKHGLGMMNWGFVAGKTQEIYPWSSWIIPRFTEPLVWFHDILRPDGTPYSKMEYNFIKNILKN